MSDEQLKRLLEDLAEDETPAHSVDLWPAIYAQVQPAPVRHSPMRVLAQIAAALLGVLLLSVAALAFYLAAQTPDPETSPAAPSDPQQDGVTVLNLIDTQDGVTVTLETASVRAGVIELTYHYTDGGAGLPFAGARLYTQSGDELPRVGGGGGGGMNQAGSSGDATLHYDYTALAPGAESLDLRFEVRYGETSAVGSGDAVITPTQTPVTPQAPTVPDDIMHTVRPGETLSGIAAEYGVSVSLLAEVNRVRDPRTLMVGMTLVIPGHALPDWAIREHFPATPVPTLAPPPPSATPAPVTPVLTFTFDFTLPLPQD